MDESALNRYLEVLTIKTSSVLCASGVCKPRDIATARDCHFWHRRLQPWTDLAWKFCQRNIDKLLVIRIDDDVPWTRFDASLVYVGCCKAWHEDLRSVGPLWHDIYRLVQDTLAQIRIQKRLVEFAGVAVEGQNKRGLTSWSLLGCIRNLLSAPYALMEASGAYHTLRGFSGVKEFDDKSWFPTNCKKILRRQLVLRDDKCRLILDALAVDRKVNHSKTALLPVQHSAHHITNTKAPSITFKSCIMRLLPGAAVAVP
mmetsp:Transcript_73361/g.184970  ORF Transcript_73361/g.184970 Transcript_73361/m.184970 type:complete len:257 (-) Transcript_73361:1748-2518(-)